MALAHKKYLTCASCARTSPPAVFAPEVQQLAANEGWLVGRRGHNASDMIRSRGQDDYCPSCRGPHELIICEGTRPNGDKCPHQAVVRLTRPATRNTPDKVVYSCAFHAWIIEKQLLIGDRDTEITVKIIEE